ncbi:E3 ubiquitin-protein ligase TRIM31-like [Mytilus californianus]|uniref:E3 ubiquitin-protein ligase TRIM31-like n=1 Tax=Mytilus californianus TaxID=6549 RepID=UPI0022472282|nr:E3 ubiquitin-protein ligase TRIM31-like [Mytilus californianus]
MSSDSECTLFQCPICLEEFIKPKALPCLHTFCKSCINEFIRKSTTLTDFFVVFNCPVCRKEVKLESCPSDPAKYLQDNHIIQSMKETCLSKGKLCSIHSSKQADHVCTEHNQIVCYKCIIDNHRFCIVTEIYEAIESKRHSITQVQNQLIIGKENMGTSVNAHSEEKKRILESERKCTDGVKLYVDELKNLIKKLESQILDDIQKNTKQILQRVDKNLTETNKEMTYLKTVLDEFEIINLKDITDFNKLTSIEQKLKTAHQRMNKTGRKSLSDIHLLRFQPNMDLFKVLKENDAIGKISYTGIKVPGNAKTSSTQDVLKCTETDAKTKQVLKLPLTTENTGSSANKATHTRPVNKVVSLKDDNQQLMSLKTNTDREDCFLTGITLLLDDSMIVADNGNMKIKHFSAGCKFVSQKVFSSEPWDVCRTEEDDFIVSFPSDNLIQYFTFRKGLIIPKQDKILTNGRCYGLSYHCNKIATCNRRASGVFIEVYAGLNGIIAELCVSASVLSECWYLSFCSDGENLVYTDQTTNFVSCVNLMSGREKWRKTIRSPRGIARCQTFMYVVNCKAAKLVCLSEDTGLPKREIDCSSLDGGAFSGVTVNTDQTKIFLLPMKGSEALVIK